ncbi:hypothetical protein [Clostridium sp.]|uniref:hypothetical protein n=1 Tax=Clostridium sp. TaxID=1506 RepID=UPI003464B2FE
MDSKLFKEGLIENDLAKIKKSSKVDVHNHCGLGMRFSTFNKWVGGNVVPPPKTMDGIKGLDEYIFGETFKYITKAEHMEFLIDGAIKEAIEDGVRILETSIDCSSIKYFENSKDFFRLIRNIKEKYKDIIDFRPEVGMPKSISNEDIEKWMIPCIESGVFKSMDLYGDESLEDFERFKECYDYGRKKGLKLKAHAGEFQGPENVKNAIEILEVEEIQHGIGAAHSNYVMDLIKERNIRLNICPSSNLILGAVKDIKNHEARKLFYKGIDITINSDDLMLFDSGVSEEYLLLYKMGVFNENELNYIREKSLKK